MKAKDGVGHYGERVAVRHLADDGLEVVARNWRCDQGELDIIALDGNVLVFVEVKTRSSERFGVPAEAVSRSKAQRIHRLARAWLAEHEHPFVGLRFDVISVLRKSAGAAEVEHLKGAF